MWSDNAKAIWGLVIGILGTSGFVAFIGWMRGWWSGKDKADTGKVHAESEKDLAEAQLNRANADTKIASAALEWADKIGVELDKMRNICDKQKMELEDVWEKLRMAKHQIDLLTVALSSLETKSKADMEHCNQIQEELDKYKKVFRLKE
jgi:chromosome segregation ATPase